jgi:plasmid stability protein
LRARESYDTFKGESDREGTVAMPIHIKLSNENVCKALQERAARTHMAVSEVVLDILRDALLAHTSDPAKATTLFLDLKWEDTRTAQEILNDFPRFRKNED